MRFSGRVAVITGAGQGLGAAFAKGFAAEGAAVALIGRTAAKLERVRDKLLEHGNPVLVCPGDVSVETDVLRIFGTIAKELGTVDILINNAAVHTSLAVVDTPLAEWQKQIDINMTGTFLCSKAVLPGMIARKYGKIVNISSSAAKHFFPGFGAYAASKAGIVGFTKTLSEEVKEHGIQVNALYLGMVNTEYTRERMGSDPAVTSELEDMLQPDEVARVVLFFASDDSAPIMGAAVDVFGRKA